MIYYDQPTCSCASSVSTADQLLAVDALFCSAGSTAKATDYAVLHNKVSASGASMQIGTNRIVAKDALAFTCASSAGTSVRLRARNAIQAACASSASSKAQMAAHDACVSSWAGYGKASPSLTGHDKTSCRMGSQSVTDVQLITHNAPSNSFAMYASTRLIGNVYTDACFSFAGSQVFTATKTTFGDAPSATVALGGATKFKRAGKTACAAKSAISCSVATIPTSTSSDLVKALRYWCQQSFPEISGKATGMQTVEVYPVISRQTSNADLPYILIASGIPTPFNLAVQSVAHRIQFDFVYHQKTFTDGATDTAQYLRDRLNVLKNNLLGDFHLIKAHGSYLSQNIEIVADPLSKTVSYQTNYSPDNVNVTCMVLSIQVTIVTSALGL